jgi:hypothetical protein
MIHYKGNLKNNVEEEEAVGTTIPSTNKCRGYSRQNATKKSSYHCQAKGQCTKGNYCQ